MNRSLTRLLLILIVTTLGACGFQPRGSVPQIAGLPGPVYISGVEQYTPLHRELSQQLAQAGIALTDDSEGAGSLLRIRDYRSDRRLFGVDTSNQGNEYELREALSFTVRSRSHGELVGEQTVRVLRILYRPNTEVLAREREQDVLREEMRRELVNRIIRRLQAQS